MSNTATVYARIDPELKKEVDGILSQLGLTPSAAVQMLYSQIKLTKGIPFDIKLNVQKPLSLEDLTAEQLNKGYPSIKEGRTYSADEVDNLFEKEYGF